MRRVLVLFAHPVLERSRVNRRLVGAVRDVENVTVHDLYEAYPTLSINVPKEQELLLSHDVIVFQHPFYWYSVPAILKEWQDLVLEHGWAYGAGGTRLRDKITLNVVSTGGPANAYRKGGYNRFTVRELLAPVYGARVPRPIMRRGVGRWRQDRSLEPEPVNPPDPQGHCHHARC